MIRSGGTIIQLDTALQAEGGVDVRTAAGRRKWEIGEFDATKSELAIETLEIATTVFEITAPPPPKSAAK